MFVSRVPTGSGEGGVDRSWVVVVFTKHSFGDEGLYARHRRGGGRFLRLLRGFAGNGRPKLIIIVLRLLRTTSMRPSPTRFHSPLSWGSIPSPSFSLYERNTISVKTTRNRPSFPLTAPTSKKVSRDTSFRTLKVEDTHSRIPRRTLRCTTTRTHTHVRARTHVHTLNRRHPRETSGSMLESEPMGTEVEWVRLETGNSEGLP